jgi:hypothetical protein
MLMDPGENCGDSQGSGLRKEIILDGEKMSGKVLIAQFSPC